MVAIYVKKGNHSSYKREDKERIEKKSSHFLYILYLKFKNFSTFFS